MLILELILIQGFTFVALIFFLKKVLYSNFARAMKRLELLNQETEKKRLELQRKLEEVEREFQTKEKENEARWQGIREQAEREAEEIRSHALTEAEREAEKLLEEARSKEEGLRRELEAGVTEKALRLAGDAVRFVFASKLDPVVHHQLVKDLTKELEEADPKRLDGRGQQAEVMTPYPLEAEEKKRLEGIIEGKIKKKITLVSQVDRSLIAGMVIKFENVILDGSLKAKLKEAVGYVRKGENST